MLWLNCNQELGRSYGMSDPSAIQSWYALGTAVAILSTAFFISKGLKEINVLILYPLISTIMLALCYFIQTPVICLIGGFVIGFAGAGGVLQLAVSTTAEFFPENKGTATSMVMIASSIANYTILTLASYITKVAGSSAPRMILLLNMGVTIIGILLALFVKANRDK
jgi:MFS family permease